MAKIPTRPKKLVALEKEVADIEAYLDAARNSTRDLRNLPMQTEKGKAAREEAVEDIERKCAPLRKRLPILRERKEIALVKFVARGG